MVPSFLARDRIVATPGFSRWLVPPAALAVHLCIGQVYATSVYKTSLVERFDVEQTTIGFIFSLAIVMLGLSSMTFGTWVDRNGPRAAMAVSTVFFVSGLLIASLGVSTGQLWLLFLGYGVVCGIGLGIGYISPVSTLIKWFPDRPGLATGMAIMGFGGGAVIAGPLEGRLLSFFDSDFDPAKATTSSADAHAITMMFLVLGVFYAVLMTFGTLTVRVPPDDWKPEGWNPSEVRAKSLVTTASVSASTSVRTPQFWLLWVVLFCNVTAGIGIVEQASPMIQDFFREGDASTVTAAAGAGFVGLLSIFNMAGRFVWSSTSDVVGRKPIYMLYLGVGLVLYLLLALVGSTSTVLFVLLAAVILSFYGGGFATVPAYLRDLFGTYQVGAIHGRLLTAWSAAGVAGPFIVNGFLDAQGEPGTLTADAYQPALLTMVGVLAVGFVANLLIRPVAEKYHEPGTDDGRATARAGEPERSTR
ncbi:OFA family MFS transporter [Nocardioides marinquilinus]|uniref:OFA family MFS transporter n=1 Tax=Nocardioides marinquilinus TaxID=1210400 RepID=A0ABP9PSQ2_9ACTN